MWRTWSLKAILLLRKWHFNHFLFYAHRRHAAMYLLVIHWSPYDLSFQVYFCNRSVLFSVFSSLFFCAYKSIDWNITYLWRWRAASTRIQRRHALMTHEKWNNLTPQKCLCMQIGSTNVASEYFASAPRGNSQLGKFISCTVSTGHPKILSGSNSIQRLTNDSGKRFCFI